MTEGVIETDEAKRRLIEAGLYVEQHDHVFYVMKSPTSFPSRMYEISPGFVSERTVNRLIGRKKWRTK